MRGRIIPTRIGVSNDAGDNAGCNTSAKNLAPMALTPDQGVLFF